MSAKPRRHRLDEVAVGVMQTKEENPEASVAEIEQVNAKNSRLQLQLWEALTTIKDLVFASGSTKPSREPSRPRPTSQ